LGDVHADQPALSRLHSKVAGLSEQVKANVAKLELVGLFGLEVMVVSGGMVSMVQV
jgi:hypothetical protein